MAATESKRILNIARRAGVLRPRDLAPYGLPRVVLSRMVAAGTLQRVGRGLYIVPDYSRITEHHSLAEACKQTPHGVICLLSALAFHDLTTEMPFQIWMAIDSSARRPRRKGPPLRIFRFSGAALREGVEDHLIEGVRVRVYNPAKTVADCFKYRNKIGRDVAVEALRDCRRQRKCTNDELWHYAKVCRMTRVMAPYLEAVQ